MPGLDGHGPAYGPGRGGRGLEGGGGPGGPKECICPSCGHKEAHTRGNPCRGKVCPVCGANLIRGRR